MKDALSTGAPGFFPFSVNPKSDVDLQPGELPLLIRSDLITLADSDLEQVIFSNRFGFALRILDAWLLYNTAATTASAVGDVTVGTTTGGAEIVAAASYTASAASGAVQALTLVINSLANGAEVFVSHDDAGAGAGSCFLFMLLGVPQLGQLG